MPRFILYSRSYCHLCDDMLKMLNALLGDTAIPVDVIDVDADSMLVARYDELVPVLIGLREGHAPRQLCHYVLDENAVRVFLAGDGY